MNVLITGVAGLVGANFAEYLLSKRQELGIDKVIGVDDLSGGYVENLDLKNVNFETMVKYKCSPNQRQNINDFSNAKYRVKTFSDT